MPSGKGISSRDCGTMWQLLYEIDGDGIGVVNFDHRPFTDFYEDATGAFDDDNKTGGGSEYIWEQLNDLRIREKGGTFRKVVGLRDDCSVLVPASYPGRRGA
ncbi:MAG: hypothetical protein HY508_14835 [Acidobacteria bacterium]|nr:hypothetical protein [Acidobacteriota bacterium]